MKQFIKSTTGLVLALALTLGTLAGAGEPTVSTAKAKKTTPVRLAKKSATLTIHQNKSKIKRGTMTIRIKKAKGVRIKKTTYTATKKGIVGITKKGKVTAKRGGSTGIKVKVKYRYKKKTRTAKLTCKVNVKKTYKNVLAGLTLKYQTYATYVGACEGINPLYGTKVRMPDDFSAWECLKLTLKDPSIAVVGACGLIIGKKAGTTTATIASTDGTGLKVTAKVRVFANESELKEKDDLYKAGRFDFLQAIRAGWTEAERDHYTDEKGNIIWSHEIAKEYLLNEDLSGIYDECTEGRQEDNTPQDAVASLLTTADALKKNESEEAAYIKTIRDKVVAPIMAAKTIDELVKVSEENTKNGLCGLFDLSGFYNDWRNETEVSNFLDDAEGADPIKEPIHLENTYDACISFPWAGIWVETLDKSDRKLVKKHMKTMLSALGMDDVIARGIDGLMKLLEDVADSYYAAYVDDHEKYEVFWQAQTVYKKFEKLKPKEHFRKKGYDVKYNDSVKIISKAPFEPLAEYMRDGKNLDALKLFLAYVSTSSLMENTRLYWTSFYRSFPEYEEEEGNVEEKLTDMVAGITDLIPFDIDQLYTKKFFSESDKKQFENTVEEYVDAYKDAIRDSEYSTIAKERMLKKMDAMRFESLCPDDETYKKLQLNYDLSTAAEGANLAENLLKVRKYYSDLECMTVGSIYGDIPWWTPETELFEYLPKDDNAYNEFTINTASFPHGGIGRNDLYIFGKPSDPETDMRNIAYMATTIGHEIGHAFDSNGMKYDENGDVLDMLEESDKAFYQAKADKLIDIYDSLLMYGDKREKKAYYKEHGCTVTESMADLGGTEIALRLIKKKYPGNDDYIRKFFIYTAEQWVYTDYELDEEVILENLDEEHPLDRQRPNGVASMMDEFYRVFDVKKTDAMYVAPEDRVVLWRESAD